MHLVLPFNEPLTLVERQMAINYLQTDENCCFDLSEDKEFCLFTPHKEEEKDDASTNLPNETTD